MEDLPGPRMSYLFGDIPYKYIGWNSKMIGHPGSRYWGRSQAVVGYIGENGKENGNDYHGIYDIWG